MADFSRPSIATTMVWIAVLAVAIVTCVVYFADRLWIGDLLSFFRPQLALATLLLLFAAVWLRRWVACLALGVALVVNAVPLYLISAPTAASADAPNLRILSANVLFDNDSQARFSDIVAELAPDIIVTQEAKLKWPGALRSLAGFPYLVGPDVSRWNGNLVLSRYPMHARLVPDMPPSGGPLGGGYAVRVEVDLPQRPRPLVVYAVHAPTPRTLVGWQARNRYLDVLAERIAAEPEGTEIVLAGDWNTPVWSPTFARTLLLSGLEATERTAWPAATRVFETFGGVRVGTPIDHVAVSRGIGVTRLFTGPAFDSDHLPVIADLKLP